VIGFTREPGAFERGLAAELALLQDLVRNRAYKYVFLTTSNGGNRSAACSSTCPKQTGLSH